MAMLLQGFATRLGLASGRDLSQACRDAFPRPFALFLWLSAELAMVATDLAEVIGFAVALSLLTGLPTAFGVGAAVLDTFILLALPSHAGRVRTLEIICALLVAVIFGCFATELALAHPPAADVLSGFLPSGKALGGDGALLVAIGILGATVMPHNLYLHSALVRTRVVGTDDSAPTNSNVQENAAPEAPSNGAPSSCMDDAAAQRSRASSHDFLKSTPVASELPAVLPPGQEEKISVESEGIIDGLSIRDASSPRADDAAVSESISLGLADTAISLSLAFIVNASILIVAGSAFSGPVAAGEMSAEEAGSLSGAYRLLAPALGAAAPTIFGVALLASGQSSTLTGTMAGQVVMEGFLDWRLKPWIRRLITRGLAIIPAAITVAVAGDSGLDRLLVLSQVVLSFQLPFAVVPLVYFVSSRKYVGAHAAGPVSTVLGWLIALFVITINLMLVTISVRGD
jgi:Mn2+/Fe2+ NRAMP family transporter